MTLPVEAYEPEEQPVSWKAWDDLMVETRPGAVSHSSGCAW